MSLSEIKCELEILIIRAGGECTKMVPKYYENADSGDHSVGVKKVAGLAAQSSLFVIMYLDSQCSKL